MDEILRIINAETVTLVTLIATMMPVVYVFLSSVSKLSYKQRQDKDTTEAKKILLKVVSDKKGKYLQKDGDFKHDNVLSQHDNKETDMSKESITTVNDYHQQAILQSAVQFWFSLLAALIGFIVIILMIITANDAQWYEYVIRTIPGIVIEAVSVLFFTQSKETRERSNDYFDRLRRDEQISKSIEVALKIDDESVKINTLSQIAIILCESGSNKAIGNSSRKDRQEGDTR